MSIDLTERAYNGPVDVTPEREQAWQLWKDDYLAKCMSGWVEQSTDRTALFQAAAVVIHDLQSVDHLPWMPLGHALLHRFSASLFAGETPAVGDAKTTFINALRTAETSTEHDRISCVAYQLGVSFAQAAQMGGGSKGTYEPESVATDRTALYRHWDVNGALLYVGIAKEPDKRGDQHRYNSKWFRFVVTTATEWLDTRALAMQAERVAIYGERPIFNETHNKRNRDAALEYLFSAIPPLADLASARQATGGAA